MASANTHMPRTTMRLLLLTLLCRLSFVDAWPNRLHLGRDKSLSDLFSYNYTIPCAVPAAAPSNITCALSIVGSPGLFLQPGTVTQDPIVGSAVVCQIVSTTDR
ncbi:hypothetical protein HDU87_000639 [Geranomyces variabilis]|uniref:Uncharacterized protein n=1 Tax=Geranomyces variabilis TaxID=109894 RepID=A0AAD5TBR2_9FUNG|nr:hypothetical protein HDU87_000639 [Geranomyces variabilis]